MQASYKRLSYIIKVIIAQINIFFVLLFLCACDNNDMNGEISVADSLAEFNQPVAVKYIDGVLETDSKISNKDRMKLLLLKTKALNNLIVLSIRILLLNLLTILTATEKPMIKCLPIIF